MPADFLSTINSFATDGTSLVRIAAIINEVLELVAAHMPTVVVHGTREHFVMQAPRLTVDDAQRLARKVGNHYRRHREIRTALLVPAGPMDHVAVRVVVFWDSAPDQDADHASLTRMGATRLGWMALPASAGALEEFLLDGVRIAVVHATADSAAQLIDDVMQGNRTDPEALQVLSFLFDGQPLFRRDVIQNWRSQARPYPATLARAMMQRHLLFYSKWSLENRIAGRGHRFYVCQLMSMMVENVIGILLAINGIYGAAGDAGGHRRWISRMKVCPHDLWRRVNHALGLGIPECIHALDPIIRETLQIVARQMPELNMRNVLSRYESSWEPCSEPPAPSPQPYADITEP